MIVVDPSAPIYSQLVREKVGLSRPTPARRTSASGFTHPSRAAFRATTQTPIYLQLRFEYASRRPFTGFRDTLVEAINKVTPVMNDLYCRMHPLPTDSPGVLTAHRRKAGREGRAIVRSGLSDVLRWLGETP